jgi:hypothetical protein
VKQKTWNELLDRFDPSTHACLCRLARDPRTRYLVVFENVTLDSSHLGDASALAIGPGHTYTDLHQVEGKWLNDLPSMRQHPQYYVDVRDKKTLEAKK